MRKVQYDRFKGIEGIWVDENADAPEPTSDTVIARVQASCINPGSVSALHGSEYVPIRDLAGTVISVGDNVNGIKVGDSVLGWAQDWSAHAELVAVPGGQLVNKPNDLAWDVAGSLFVTPMAGLAAVDAVEPSEGELVVVAGATGGVGFTAAQLAKHRGATVIGIASPTRAELLRQHGIIPVAYDDSTEQNVRTAAEGSRIHAFIDTVGADYLALAARLNVPAARIATVVNYKHAREFGAKAVGTMDAGGIAALTRLSKLAAIGLLNIPIALTFPLREVQAAYRALASNRAVGRVVLHPQA